MESTTVQRDARRKEILDRLGLSKEEAIAKSIGNLTDNEKVDFTTNLLPGEDSSFAVMDSIAERYDLPWLKDYVLRTKRLRTSVNGWRASQLVSVIAEKMREAKKGVLSRIFHRNDEKNNRWKVDEFE